MTAPYQIFRKLPDNKFIWIENIDELQEARARLDFLSTVSDADYILFDPRDRTVVPQPARSIQPQASAVAPGRYELSGLWLLTPEQVAMTQAVTAEDLCGSWLQLFGLAALEGRGFSPAVSFIVYRGLQPLKPSP